VNKKYNYESEYYWDSPYIELYPPARAELQQQPRSVTQRDHLRRMGDSEFNVDAFIKSEMGRAVADLITGYPVTDSDENPAADAYWNARGYKREYHKANDPAHDWVSLVPKDARPGELFPTVVLIHGGQAQGLASGMETSGYIHEIIKRDRAVFILPANAETPNTIRACDEAEEVLPIDKSRMYIIGFSGGAAWARYTALTNVDRFAAYAPNGSHMMSWPTLISDEQLVEIRRKGLPVCIYAGLNEFLKIFPLNRKCDKFMGIMGKDEQPGIPDEKYMLFRRCLYASGCEDINLTECYKSAEDENPARRMCAVPGGDARIETICGFRHAVIDFKRQSGDLGMRVICVEGMPHVVAPSACALVWDMLRRHKREGR